MKKRQLLKIAEQLEKQIKKELSFKVWFKVEDMGKNTIAEADCRGNMYKITFSTYLISGEFTEKEIIDVVKHELTHIYEYELIGYHTGHRKAFRDLCGKLWNDRNIGKACIIY